MGGEEIMKANKKQRSGERAAKASEKSPMGAEIAELKLRVLIAELRARQVEAEIRLVNAMEKRRELRKDNLRAFKKIKSDERKRMAKPPDDAKKGET